MRHHFRKVKHHFHRIKRSYKLITLGILLVLTIPLTMYLLQREQDARTIAQIRLQAFNQAKVFTFSTITYPHILDQKTGTLQTTPSVQISIANESNVKKYLQENNFFAPNTIVLEKGKEVVVKNVAINLVEEQQLYYPDVRYAQSDTYTHPLILSSFGHMYNPVDQTLVVKFYLSPQIVQTLSNEGLSDYINERIAKYLYFLGNRPDADEYQHASVDENNISDLFSVQKQL